MLSLLASLLTAGATATPTTSASFGTLPFEIEAERFTGDPKLGVFDALGQVVARRADLLIAAERVHFDQLAHRAIAEGSVVILEGTSVITCERVVIELPGLRTEITDAVLRIKRGISHAELASKPVEQMAASGKTELSLGVGRLVRTGTRSFQVEHGRFTPCDCGEGRTPTWRIEASHASVDLDAGAWLTAPVFYAGEVPVLILPVFYVPLGERRSGLLAPRGGYSTVTGLMLSEPLYLVFNRSYDATLELSHDFARGPAPTAELRWAATASTSGRIRATVLSDFGELGPSGSYQLSRSTPWVRYALSGHDRSAFDGGLLAVELNLLGDPRMNEFADAYLARQVETSLSRATLSHAERSGFRAAASLAFLEDLRPTSYGVDPSDGEGMKRLREVAILGNGGFGEPGRVRYRLVEGRADQPPTPWLSDQLLFEARLSAQAFVAPSPEVSDFARADLRPAISAPVFLGPLTLTPSLAARMTGWSGAETSATRFGLITRATLSTELSRRFGELVHAIRPSFEYLLIPLLDGGAPLGFQTHDEIDRLGRVQQVAGRIATELSNARTGRRLVGFEALLGQDLGLSGAPGLGTSELVLRADAELSTGPEFRARVDLRGVFDLSRAEADELSSGLQLDFGRSLHLDFRYVTNADQVPRASLIAPEELVPSRTSSAVGAGAYVSPKQRAHLDPRTLPWAAFSGITAGIGVRPLASLLLSLSINAGLTDLATTPPPPAGALFQKLRSVGGSLRWDPPCDCLSATLQVVESRDRGGLPDILFDIDLARLGHVGR